MNHSTKQNPLLPSTLSISSLKHSTPVFASRASCDTHETSPRGDGRICGKFKQGWKPNGATATQSFARLYVSSLKDDVPVHGLSEEIVGVLGGGQLGHILCQAASQMAIKVMVLDPLENCPASALSYHHIALMIVLQFVNL